MRKDTFLPEIQGLRAIAVAMVVLYHSGLDLVTGGYVGVDVFFVLSGYLITGLLVKEVRTTGTVDIVAFYGRRIRRLLPAAGLVLMVTLVLVAWLYSPLEIKQFSSSAFATALYFSNLWFAYLSTDYLADDTAANPFLHTWSLSVEEQFYLVWPALILFLFGLGRRSRSAGLPMFGIVLVTAVSFAASVYLTMHNQPWAFFGSPTRAWEFAIGGLVALVRRDRVGLGQASLYVLSAAGMAAILSAALVYDNRTAFPGAAALLPVLGTAAVLLAVHWGGRNPLHKILRTAPFRIVGDISYSLYLWHWPVFVFLPMLVPDIEIYHRAMGIALSAVLAWFTHRWVENPFRFGIASRANPTKGAFVLGVVVSIGAVSSALAARYAAIDGLSEPRQVLYKAAREDIADLYTNPTLDGCHAKYPQTEVPECVFGNPQGARTIVLFGDSHAAQWFPALEAIAARTGSIRLISLTKTACPSVVFEPFNATLGRGYTECTQWRNGVFQRIAEERPDLIVIANSSRHPTSTSSREQWRKGLEDTVNKLADTGAQVVVIADTPWLEFSAPICLSRAAWRGQEPNAVCRFVARAPDEDPVAQIELSVLAGRGDAAWVDMNKVICPANECAVLINGMVMFHDSHHLTASYSKSLSDPLAKFLQQSGSLPL